MMARIFSAYIIILTVVCSVYCDLVYDNNGTAAADMDGEALLELGRQFNKPVLTLMGMAIRNLEKLHPCDDWTAWSDCGTVRVGYISTKRRNRKCSYKTKYSIDVRNETEINICEGFCPRDYDVTANGYCMKLYVNLETQADAEKRCQEDGGYLVNIDSERKYEDVKTILKGFSVPYVYISGRRKDANSEWEFLYGNKTGFYKWASSEPDNSDTCLAIRPSTFLWYGKPCTPTYPYLCEIIGLKG